MEIYIIVIIGIFQFVLFGKNCFKLYNFKNIFPNNNALSIIKDSRDTVKGIDSKHRNKVFETIIESMNKYLANNKGQVSDFHLMKDIVDRNTDAQEDEINTQIPIPLYLGLIGTMSCILIGLKFLDLNTLVTGSGIGMAQGINPLLSGVALAMITSIIGIFLTTSGSFLSKNATAKVEKNKNDFLSWMQAELLPNLSNDTAQTLQRMTENLSDFNRTFAQNNTQFTATLAQVADTSNSQKELIRLISKLSDKDITQKNLLLLKKLIAVSEQIGTLSDNLQNVNVYTENLHRIIREISDYFKAENEQIEQRKDAFNNSLNGISNVIVQKLPETFNQADLKVRAALEEFNKNFVLSLKRIHESIDGQILDVNNAVHKQQFDLVTVLAQQKEELEQHFATVSTQMQTTANEQQEIFKQKLEETTALVEELKNLSEIKKGIAGFEKAIAEQNIKIDNLTDAIYELAKTKAVIQAKKSLSEKISNWWRNLSLFKQIVWAVLIVGSILTALIFFTK